MLIVDYISRWLSKILLTALDVIVHIRTFFCLAAKLLSSRNSCQNYEHQETGIYSFRSALPELVYALLIFWKFTFTILEIKKLCQDIILFRIHMKCQHNDF